jgi:hypothetical protein
MPVTEEGRHQLYQKLEEALGRAEATTLMEHLPPLGWADVATKRDLDGLEERFDLRLESLEERFVLKLQAVELRLGERLQSEVGGLKSVMLTWALASNATIAAAVIAAAKLL